MAFDFLGTFYGTEYFKGFNLLFRGSHLIASKTYPHKNNFSLKKYKGVHASLTFIDTLNYAPFSVEKLGKIINLPKLKYLSLGFKPKNKEEWDKLKTYNIRDSTISLRFLQFLYNAFSSLGADIKMTIASTSKSLFQNKYLNQIYWRHSREIIIEQFKGYYGGRCEVFRRGVINPSDKLKYYDVNSLYPFEMCTHRYPNPNTLRVTYRNTLEHINEYEGMSDVSLYCPNMQIPLLPYRHDNKLLFPVGNFRGLYCHNELREAIKLGYKITHVHKTYYYTGTCTPFKEFVEDLYKQRMEYKKLNSPMELVVKLLLNSLYGKFGEKFTDKDDWVLLENVTIEDLDGKDFEIIDGKFVRFKKENFPPSHCIPIWSAYVTAYGRMTLHKYLLECDDVYYCDTDSIMTPNDIITSKEIGGLKLEMSIEKGILVKPKFYAVVDGNNNKFVKIKGIGKKLEYDDFIDIMHNKKVEYEKITKFKEAVRRGLTPNETIEIIKRLDLSDNKRTWETDFTHTSFTNSKPRFINIDV
jgi:hypothetical protein